VDDGGVFAGAEACENGGAGGAGGTGVVLEGARTREELVALVMNKIAQSKSSAYRASATSRRLRPTTTTV